MDLSILSENFLHYTWKFGLFDNSKLVTKDGKTIEILSPGVHNQDAGPDFSSAQLKVDGTTWVGNVEIHINSSDWQKHNHDKDENYKSIILHVVYNHDVEIPSLVQNNVPTLSLKHLIHKSVFDKYLALQSAENDILCSNQINQIEPIIISGMIEKCAHERLDNKSIELERIFLYAEKDWEKTLYILLGKYFGVRVNTDPFERLVRSLDLSIIRKHMDDPIQIDALLFGQSGMLPSKENDPYVSKLKSEYTFLREKYKLKPLEIGVWKFARMRPISFPSLRIAYFSNLITSQDFLFSKILSAKTSKDIITLLECRTHEYFDTHYHFTKESAYQKKKLGLGTKERLVINAIAPLLYFYGRKMDNLQTINKATTLLESIKPEKNKINSKWENLGIQSTDALQSQGLIELTKSYCLKKRCVDCNIGFQLLKA